MEELSYSQLPSNIRETLYRLNVRRMFIEQITKENTEYIIQLKQAYRLGDENFSITETTVRYLYRSAEFKEIRNPDRRQGLILVFEL